MEENTKGKKEPQQGAYRLLCVDDSTEQLDLMRVIFKAPRYDTTVVTSGDKALEALASDKNFDAVILDIEMPGLSGFEVCKEIRGKLGLPLLPVLFVSAHVKSEYIQQASLVGGDEFIVKPFNKDTTRERVDALADQKRRLAELEVSELVLFALARMVEARDTNSGDHCDRLVHMCGVFADKLGLSSEQRRDLDYACILHDVGKVIVSDEVLKKPGPLSTEDWRMMRRHTVVGSSLCSSIKDGAGVVEIVRHHHERFDGSGYPDGLKGNDIPLLARVFQVVDLYDSMSNPRSYSDAFPRDKVIKVLMNEARKGRWDIELMQKFMEIASKEPASLERSSEAKQAMSEYKINAILDSTMLIGKGS